MGIFYFVSVKTSKRFKNKMDPSILGSRQPTGRSTDCRLAVLAQCDERMASLQAPMLMIPLWFDRDVVPFNPQWSMINIDGQPKKWKVTIGACQSLEPAANVDVQGKPQNAALDWADGFFFLPHILKRQLDWHQALPFNGLVCNKC
jgi:hypothetical protein